jgi:hypothetical protein
MRHALIIVATLLTCSYARAQNAQVTDITNDVKTHIIQQLVGQSVADGPTVIDRHQIHTPFGDRTIWEDRAKGTTQVVGLDSMTGTITRIVIPSLGLDIVTADCRMTFKWKSETSCDRIATVGGAIIDHPWGSLHPEGTVTVSLTVNHQENGRIESNIAVTSGGNDRPNNYIKEHLISGLVVPKAAQLLSHELGVTIH